MNQTMGAVSLFVLICALAFGLGFYARHYYSIQTELEHCTYDLHEHGRMLDGCIEDVQTCESVIDLGKAIEASEVQFGPDSPATELLRRADDAYSRKEGVR